MRRASFQVTIQPEDMAPSVRWRTRCTPVSCLYILRYGSPGDTTGIFEEGSKWFSGPLT